MKRDDGGRRRVEDDRHDEDHAHPVVVPQPAAGERPEGHAEREAREHVGDVARHARRLGLEHDVDLERRVVGHVHAGQQVAGDQPGPARRQREADRRRHGDPPHRDDDRLETDVVGGPGAGDVADRRHHELDGDQHAGHGLGRAELLHRVDVEELVVEPEAEREQQVRQEREPQVAAEGIGTRAGARRERLTLRQGLVPRRRGGSGSRRAARGGRGRPPAPPTSCRTAPQRRPPRPPGGTA